MTRPPTVLATLASVVVAASKVVYYWVRWRWRKWD